ncbi:hypothetical protein ACIGZJ_31940 [Kitasatospora sp. NPDC052868]|uniref:hypothetical protein n=1 Tax=Kitasatospora sp. NPDC052868 TaxID=3364060 RepID=UPI0037C74292
MADLISPWVESEFAFRLGEDLAGEAVDVAATRSAVSEVMVALEVIDTRYRGWQLTLADSVADVAELKGGLSEPGSAYTAAVREGLRALVDTKELTLTKWQQPTGVPMRPAAALYTYLDHVDDPGPAQGVDTVSCCAAFGSASRRRARAQPGGQLRSSVEQFGVGGGLRDLVHDARCRVGSVAVETDECQGDAVADLLRGQLAGLAGATAAAASSWYPEARQTPTWLCSSSRAPASACS